MNYADNTALPTRPTAADLPHAIIWAAGLQDGFRRLATDRAPSITYVQNAGSETFVAGDGFAPDAQVSFAGTPPASVSAVSPAFLVATATAGTHITVTTSAGSAYGTVPPTSVGLGKPASQSSNYSSKYPAGNAIDGNVGNFADTAEETQP